MTSGLSRVAHNFWGTTEKFQLNQEVWLVTTLLNFRVSSGVLQMGEVGEGALLSKVFSITDVITKFYTFSSTFACERKCVTFQKCP